ncbi:MAG: hypothetical protein KF816_09905 [Melioribacteraceae bacterium]|nr:hypothetical protein [Melioribacteraceae bacterium]
MARFTRLVVWRGLPASLFGEVYTPRCLARFTRLVVWRGLPGLLIGGCGGNHFLTESSLDPLANGLEMTINYSPEIQRRIQNLIPYFSLLASKF